MTDLYRYTCTTLKPTRDPPSLGRTLREARVAVCLEPRPRLHDLCP